MGIFHEAILYLAPTPVSDVFSGLMDMQYKDIERLKVIQVELNTAYHERTD